MSNFVLVWLIIRDAPILVNHRQNFQCTETPAAATECQAQQCGNISTLMMTTSVARLEMSKYRTKTSKLSFFEKNYRTRTKRIKYIYFATILFSKFFYSQFKQAV